MKNIITISREFGSGGRELGRRIAALSSRLQFFRLSRPACWFGRS